MKPITIGTMIRELLNSSLSAEQREFIFSSAMESDFGATTSKLSNADVDRIDALYQEICK